MRKRLAKATSHFCRKFNHNKRRKLRKGSRNIATSKPRLGSQDSQLNSIARLMIRGMLRLWLMWRRLIKEEKFRRWWWGTYCRVLRSLD